MQRQVHRVFPLHFDASKWTEVNTNPENTLQLFITSRCDKRCPCCFYRDRLGNAEMPLEKYKQLVDRYLDEVSKIVLIGGEPTMHPEICDMISYNNDKGLRTTIYTNGFNLGVLSGTDLDNVSIRLDPKNDLRILLDTNFLMPVTVVFMIDMGNYPLLLRAAKFAESQGCKKFFISSIRDIHISKSYWRDTKDTVPLFVYHTLVQNFLNEYDGKMEIHLSKRGVLYTEESEKEPTRHCRFLNIFPDDSKIICPFDIAKDIKTDDYAFGTRLCNKNECNGCLLRKIVLKRR